MHRRTFLTLAAIGTGGVLASPALPTTAHQATPDPVPADFADSPPDTRARELISLLATIDPLTLLEALETAAVNEPLLIDPDAPDVSVTAVPWSDPGDTDLEHALGGVMLTTDNHGINNPDTVFIGGYIVFESAEIAYDQLNRDLGDDPNYPSTTAAGTKVWLVDDAGLGVMRLANVIAIATAGQRWSEGVVLHLDTVARSLA